MPLRSQRPAKAYLFPQLGPVEGEQMEPTPTPAPGWPAGAQGPGITLPAARTPPWVTPTPTTGATTIGATAPSPTSESPATPFGPPGTPFAPPVDPSAPEIVDYPPNGSIRYRYLVDKMQETDANGKPTGKWVLDWYHYKLLGQLPPDGWPETKVNPQTGEIMGWDIKAADYTMSTGRYAPAPTPVAPGAPPEAVLKYRSNPDGGIVQYYQPWKLVKDQWGEDVATGEDNYRMASQAKTADERQIILDQQKREADAEAKAYRDEQTRIANENLILAKGRAAEKRIEYFEEPDPDGSVWRRGYQVNPDGTLSDVRVYEKQIKWPSLKPTTAPPGGISRFVVPQTGEVKEWDSTDRNYVTTGYEATEFTEAARKAPGLAALEKTAAEGRWLLEFMRGEKERRAKEEEEAFTRGQVQPFSAILGAIQQRTGQPVGAPANYEEFLKALYAGQVPQQAPQPQGAGTPLWNLPGGQVATINALRGAGAQIPGTTSAWYDVPGVGRVHAGAPEFQQMLAAGQKPYVPGLPENVINQYSPDQDKVWAALNALAPTRQGQADVWSGQAALAPLRQTQSVFATTNPYAAMFAEQDRAKAEEKQREIQGLAQQLNRPGRFWQ